MRFVFELEPTVTRRLSEGDKCLKNNEFGDIMPTKEICVNPSDKRSIDEDKSVDSETKAMLQNLGSSYPSAAAAVAAHNASPPSLSSPSSTYDICRICHCEAEADAPLIAPCYCSGSLLYVHQSCLQQWIKSSDTRKCELCHFEFIMQTKIKPFTQWEKLDVTAVERRKIFCSVTFHVVAITCVVWSLYVLIDRTAEEVRSGILEWPFWTKLIVVAIGFTGGLVFMYVQCKMYVQLCRRWKAFNRIIYIQNAPTKAMLAAALNDSNSGNFNCPPLNSVQMFDHMLQPPPPFSPTKCEPALTVAGQAVNTNAVTCIEMTTTTNPRVHESKAPAAGPPPAPLSSLPPSTAFGGRSLMLPSSDNISHLLNSSVNMNNNNNNNNNINNSLVSGGEEARVESGQANSCQLQIDRVS